MKSNFQQLFLRNAKREKIGRKLHLITKHRNVKILEWLDQKLQTSRKGEHAKSDKNQQQKLKIENSFDGLEDKSVEKHKKNSKNWNIILNLWKTHIGKCIFTDCE